MSSTLSYHIVEQRVSSFITSMIGVRWRPNMNRFYAFQHFITKRIIVDDIDCTDRTVIDITGSGSEFYIEPIPSLVGDIDIMFHINDLIAVPKGHRFPCRTQLPLEFSVVDRVMVFQMVDSDYPGYVFLEYVGSLIQCENANEHEFISSESESQQMHYLRFRPSLFQSLGPAVKVDGAVTRSSLDRNTQYSNSLSVDQVRCFRCLEWPPQAAYWPVRTRNHGWPDPDTIQRIVSNGSDLVITAHCDCRHDDWTNRRMFRNSFSRAETVLLNEWTVKQQIVYHLIRYFAKSNGLTENPAKEPTATADGQPDAEKSKTVFSNYNFKTLMLWACERRSQHWWTKSLVGAIIRLLRAASVMLESAECENYFVSGSNLLDDLIYVDQFRIESCRVLLKSITGVQLSMWLRDNYIRDCAEKCPSYVSKVMQNIVASRIFDRALSTLVKWRTNNLSEMSWRNFQAAMRACQRELYEGTPLRSVYSIRQQVEQVRHVDERLVPFFIALTYLRITKLTDNELENNRLLIYTHELVCKSAAFEMNSIESKAVVPVALHKHITADYYLAIELFKALLHPSLDAGENLENIKHKILLASLYYITKQYRTALGHCMSVITFTRSTWSLKIAHSPLVVEKEFLETTDDNIDRVLGLMCLYRCLHSGARTLNEQPERPNDGVFTAELLAFYFAVQCLRKIGSDIELISTTRIARRYVKSIVKNVELLVEDFLLNFLAQPVHVDHERRPIGRSYATFTLPVLKSSCSKFNTVRLRSLLLRSAVRNLSTVHSTIKNDYSDDVRTLVATDYEALYAYKCGEYDRCFTLCRQNVNILINGIHFIPTLAMQSSDLLLLTDDDFLSVAGLFQIVGCVPSEFGIPEVDQRTISLYLLVQCKLRLNHTSRSLAGVLSLIDKANWHHSHENVFHCLLLAYVYRKARRVKTRR